MKRITKTLLLSFLMLVLGLSAATSSLNESTETTVLDEVSAPQEVILPLSSLNEPGHQEGSIFTDTTLSSGGEHTCAILDDGTVSCWGEGNNGQLGNGGISDQYTPTLTSSLGTGRTAVAISSGSTFTCAILDDGSVSCWGANNFGQLGDGTTSTRYTPTPNSGFGIGRTAVALSSGSSHTCAILDDGSVSCWGKGNNGQLGANNVLDRTTPINNGGFGTGRTAVAISSGLDHTCAILDDGSVSCWGAGNNGQLGNGGISDQYTPTLTSSLGAGRTAVALSSGYTFTCAILDDGSVSCWGRGDSGQLGNGETLSETEPMPTDGFGTGRTAVAISSGSSYTCAVLDDGSVSCWGKGINGQLGNGGTSDLDIPTATSSLGTGRTAVTISSGEAHTCAILDDGSVSCWGAGGNGQLGNGGTSDETTPTPTSSLGTSTNPRTAALSERDFDGDGTLNIFQAHSNLDYRESTLSTGGNHNCIILDNGSVSCWGRNNDGQLGNGGTTPGVHSGLDLPTLTSSLGAGRTAVALSSGGEHTCAILDNGSVSCWGINNHGQLGNGGTSDKTTPTLTSSLGAGRTAVALSSGGEHTCAILDNGSVSCWGRNNDGQLGIGGTQWNTVDKTTPTLTSSLGTGRTAVAISSGSYYTCAILDNGEVSCWGDGNKGQLGYGGNFNKFLPTLTNSLGADRTAVVLSAGEFHTCVILDNGDISCWGGGDYGQLGNGAFSNRYSPTLTSSLGTGRTAVAISSGVFHTCAILDNGSVSCWGYGESGQLGYEINDPYYVATPNLTSSLGVGRTAIGLSSGAFHTCAILDNGSVSCWGGGDYGQLGNGTTSSTYTPNLTSSLGVGRTALLVDGDVDGDGMYNHFDPYPENSFQSIKCDAGQYGRYVCVDSPLGKYVLSSGSIYAIDASPGYYVDQIGQFSQTACLAGTYNPNTGSTNPTDCLDASQGHYVNSSLGTGQSTQTACLAGTYNPNFGSITSTDCIVANQGHYVNSSLGTGQSTQTACLAGTYNPNSGSIISTDCLNADAGHYVLSSGQSSQTPCSIGTFQTSTGQPSCDEADIGYYVDQIGQSTQVQCQPGFTTLTTRSTIPTQCLSDFDGDATVDIFDNDDDDDGVLDTLDQCLTSDFDLSADNDNDGCDDADEDTDDDNDGVLDVNDAFPLDSTESVDTDDDGTGDNADTDDDGDLVLDADDAFPLDSTESVDTDDDGTGDNADTDDDGDLVLDADDAFPLDSTESVDTDNDGIGNNADTDDDGDGVSDTNDAFPLDSAESVDTDDDGTGDNADTDDDGDSVLDANDAFPLDSTESVDTDNDGTGDNADTDDDGDLVLDADDAFSLDATESIDTDGDGTGDNADLDDDGDNVADIDDDLPFDATESVDTDNDGIGNNADTDDDGDGVSDSNDDFPEDSTEWDDVNGDGLGDNKDPLSSFESAQQEPVLPILGILGVIAVMAMLYRAQPPLKQEEKTLVDISQEE